MIKRMAQTVFAVWALGVAATAADVQVTWTPEHPTRDDRVVIRVKPITQPAWIHWGVNARGSNWQQPVEAYRPAGSRVDGVALQTALIPLGTDDVAEAVLGPFNTSTQAIGSVDFAILFEDNTWESRDGKDYHIPITQDRIRTRPAHPGPNDRITVEVRRSAPGGQLRWGVNARRGAWTRPAKGYWPAGSIPSDDGVALDSPLPPPDAQGISRIQLGPFDNGVQAVTSIHMAVHWDAVWDTDCGKNYEALISLDSGRPVSPLDFVAPENGDVVSREFGVLLNSRKPVQLWLDGTEMALLQKEPYRFTVPVSNLTFGLHRLSARQGEPGNYALAGTEFWYGPAFTVTNYPDDAPLGATESAPGLVTFALHAPEKHFISLIGDFNRWDPSADPLHYSTNGTWWLTRPLPPGEHRYQYLVDGTRRLADPYSTDVEWIDAKGRETYQPELAVSRLVVGGSPFPWTGEANYQRPAISNLIIYELSIPDTARGGYTGLIERLDYIRDLGVTAIEPMPWTEFAGAQSWGYNPAFHFAPESAYGTPDQLRLLIDEAHRRGLAVIMDMVLNHMDAQSALFQLYGDDYEASPYFYLFMGENWGFPDLDQESPAVKRYANDAIAHWSRAYHVDGFRYDATRWVGWEGYNDYGASWFAWCGRQVDPDSFQIAEHLPSDTNLVNLTEMDSGWSAEFRWRICEVITRGTFQSGDLVRLLFPLRTGFSNSLQNVIYTESHDEDRLFTALAERYPPEQAARRAVSALAITLTAPGLPMLYAGQEWGEATPKIVGPNPLHWEKRNDPNAKIIHQATRDLCRLRTRNPALKGDALQWVLNDEQNGLIVYRRQTGNREVLIAVNVGQTLAEFSLPLSAGIWRTVLTGGLRRLNVPVELTCTLPPGACTVLEKIPMDAAEPSAPH